MDRELGLLRAWRQGDTSAGKRLFSVLFDDLYAFFRNKCRQPEDMVQKTLLACLEASERFEERASFRVFVFSIAKNQLYSHWRSFSRRPADEGIGTQSFAALDPSPSEVLHEQDTQRELLAALRCVPLEDQVLLESYYWQNLTGPELAAVMGLTEPAVRSRLRRALQRLRREVERAGAHEDVTATLQSLDGRSARLQALQSENEPP